MIFLWMKRRHALSLWGELYKTMKDSDADSEAEESDTVVLLLAMI